MRELELREKKVNGVQTTGDKLLRDGHPAKKTIEVELMALPQFMYNTLHFRNLNSKRCDSMFLFYIFSPQAFTAALQTQWSWILQLCCCIETHLKENTAYFQVCLLTNTAKLHYLKTLCAQLIWLSACICRAGS